MAVSVGINRDSLFKSAWKIFFSIAEPLVVGHDIPREGSVSWRLFKPHPDRHSPNCAATMKCWPTSNAGAVIVDFSGFTENKINLRVDEHLLQGALELRDDNMQKLSNQDGFEARQRWVIVSLTGLAKKLSDATGYDIEIQLPFLEYEKYKDLVM